MAQTSPRAELISFHKKTYLQNKKIIEELVSHEDKNFRQYEADYLKSVRHFKSVSSHEEMMASVMKADIIYVGDFHTLNQSQRSLLRLLRELVLKTKDFILAFEVIRSDHQNDLERFLKDRISEKTFLKKISFKEQWFFDLWANFKPLFDFSKYHKLGVYGLEANPDVASNLYRRDIWMARRIVALSEMFPNKKMVVFVGDLHIAKRHLPLEVTKIFRKKNKKQNFIILHQNSDAIYWKLAAHEMEDKINVVKISDNEFCRMHTPPVIAQQSYLNWLEHEEDTLDYADAKHSFLTYLDKIAQFLEIKTPPQKEDIEIFTCGDLSFLKRLKEDKIFSFSELKEIKRQIAKSQSYYIPKKKYVYLANVSVNHAAEEAAHVLRHLCLGEEFPRVMQDSFYAAILYEALGFFGSKIINPKRKCLRPVDCRSLVTYLHSTSLKGGRLLEFETARLFLEHEEKVLKGDPFLAPRIAHFSVDLFLSLTQALGYFLGEKMFYGLLQNKLPKEAIRRLYSDEMEEEGDPVVVYLGFVEALKKVVLPRRN